MCPAAAVQRTLGTVCSSNISFTSAAESHGLTPSVIQNPEAKKECMGIKVNIWNKAKVRSNISVKSDVFRCIEIYLGTESIYFFFCSVNHMVS